MKGTNEWKTILKNFLNLRKNLYWSFGILTWGSSQVHKHPSSVSRLSGPGWGGRGRWPDSGASPNSTKLTGGNPARPTAKEPEPVQLVRATEFSHKNRRATEWDSHRSLKSSKIFLGMWKVPQTLKKGWGEPCYLSRPWLTLRVPRWPSDSHAWKT